MVALSKKECVSLWAIVIKKEPDTATRLLSLYVPKKTPLEVDLGKIPEYFTTFCLLQNIRPDKYRGPLYKSSKINQRRLFVGAIISIYGEPWGIATALSKVIDQHQPNTTKMIKEVQMAYKTNDDFMEAVDRIVEKLKGGV